VIAHMCSTRAWGVEASGVWGAGSPPVFSKRDKRRHTFDGVNRDQLISPPIGTIGEAGGFGGAAAPPFVGIGTKGDVRTLFMV
jgi:hypothetical protein